MILAPTFQNLTIPNLFIITQSTCRKVFTIDYVISTSPSDYCCHPTSVSIAIKHSAQAYIRNFTTHGHHSILWLTRMRKQKVVVDVWKMVFSSCSYLALAFVAYILLKLVYACFWLPNYLRKQEEPLVLDSAEDVKAGEVQSEEEDDKKNVQDAVSALSVFVFYVPSFSVFKFFLISYC